MAKRKTLRPTIYRGEGGTGVDPKGIENRFGPIGTVYAVTVHHSAGPRAQTHAQAKALNRAYDQQHRNQGWGGIGYHASIDDLGRVYTLRPSYLKGAHTGGHNTGNIGIMFHGNYVHDKLTVKQKQTLEWLFKGGFFTLFGVSESRIQMVRGHQEWPGPTNATACPGTDIMRSLVYRRNKDLNR